MHRLSGTHRLPSISAPANAKSHNCFEHSKGLPWKHPVRNSSWFCPISPQKPVSHSSYFTHPVWAFRTRLVQQDVASWIAFWRILIRLTFLGMILFCRMSCGVNARSMLSPIKLYKIKSEGYGGRVLISHTPKVGMSFCPLNKWIRVTECIYIVNVIPWKYSSSCRYNHNI